MEKIHKTRETIHYALENGHKVNELDMICIWGSTFAKTLALSVNHLIVSIYDLS